MIGWLIIGLLLAGGLPLLLSWWANAEAGSAKTSLMWAVILLCAVMAVVLFAAGRGIMALFPALYAGWRMFNVARTVRGLGDKAKSFRGNQKPIDGNMSQEEALEVLGLEGDPGKEEINAAYRKLMSQCHPDKGGSDWMAAKLSEAKRVLLDK